MSKTPSFKKVTKGLAGALAIASGTSAYGGIVYTNPPLDLTTTPGGPTAAVSWDVNGDGINDFRFEDRYSNASGSMGIVWQLSMNPLQVGNGVVGYTGPFLQYAYALHYGDFIGPNSNFTTESRVVLGSKYRLSSSTYYYGGFAGGNSIGSVQPGTLAFAGFRFQAADGTHYGWIRLRVNAGIIDFADSIYNTTPNEGLVTILEPFIPEPGTLALLALGAVGVIGAVAKRRRT